MNEWIQTILSSDQAGISVLAAVFLLGVIGVFSCACNYAVIGTVAGYTGSIGSTGRKKTVVLSSMFFLLGTVISMSIIGLFIGFTGEFISNSIGSYWKIAAGVISILFGLYTVGLFPFKIPGISINVHNHKSGIFSAVIFGLAIGGVSSLCGLCCSPFFPVIMAASFIKGNAVWGFLMLLSYALGYGLTLAAAMLGLGLGLGKISTSLSRFANVLKYIAGILMIAIGFYFLITI
ncbi:MAG TPA: cytochrome c biogenesis protein CcdA [Bacteroidales bacterium]|nr:cytochrome c biogenesis protein CcdA [Bacteroidales bacterium]